MVWAMMRAAEEPIVGLPKLWRHNLDHNFSSDGSQRQFDAPVTLMDVAMDIGPGLAKATVCGRVDGVLMDACEH